MIDVSLIIPAIRTNGWLNFYNSIEKSCKKYLWELILISPFDLPDELKEKNNIKLIKDFGCPTRCLQLGIFEAQGKLCAHTVDDAVLFEDKLDEAIDYYKQNCGYKDVVNLRYREGENYSGQTMRDSYWMAWGHDALRLTGIPQHYKISLHHLLNTDYLIEMGGYDCSFEHANFSNNDLMFRIQADGGKLFDSVSDITTCNHMPDETGDHSPIFKSHNEHDLPLFRQMYSDPDILKKRIKIDINNWASAPSVWTRRFNNGIPKEYKDLIDEKPLEIKNDDINLMTYDQNK